MGGGTGGMKGKEESDIILFQLKTYFFKKAKGRIRVRTDLQRGDWNDLALHLGGSGLRKGLAPHLRRDGLRKGLATYPGRIEFINTYRNLGRAVLLTSHKTQLFSLSKL